MDSYKELIDETRIPRHVAIIMDGNGRWAKARGMHRTMGHQAGVSTVKEITEAATRLGLDYLTLYTFSTENWNRPADEVNALMGLILSELEEELFIKLNESGLGPMGLGGSSTVLGVRIKKAYCHTASLPVAVNIGCWATRRATARIKPDGTVEYIQGGE